MKKEKWESMTDEQKTQFMRNVFKEMNLGETFDYAECRKGYNNLQENGKASFGVFENPCLTLELVDPIMARKVMDWMYICFDENGNYCTNGDTAPLFGYNMKELILDKHSLMDYNENEKAVLRDAIRIINRHVKAFKGE